MPGPANAALAFTLPSISNVDMSRRDGGEVDRRHRRTEGPDGPRSLMRALGWANGGHCQLQLGRHAMESRQMISLISRSGSQIHMGVAADAIILDASQPQPARVMF